MIFKKIDHDCEELEAFLSQQSLNNIFYSKEWQIFLNSTINSSSFIYCVQNEKGNLLGVIMGVIDKNLFWPINKLTKRAIIHGGPYIINKDKNVLQFLLENYNKEIGAKVIYSQFRNQREYSSKEKEIFCKNGFYYEPHLNILHDLEFPIKFQFEKLHKGRRKNIRRAVRAGVKFREIIDDNEFRLALELVESTYNRVKMPMPNKTFFKVGFQNLTNKNILKTFVAVFNKQIIGCRLVLCYGDVIYDWYSGASNEHLNKYPNDFLPWKVMEWASQNGFKCFDFGGAGKPHVHYGVREHKLKFGGELVEFGRFEKIHKKSLMKVGKIGLKLYKYIK